MFLLWDTLIVTRVSPWPAAVAQAGGFWEQHPILLLVVADDVAAYLAELPQSGP